MVDPDKAAAEYLSISRSKLYEWALTRRIRSLKIDRRRLFDVHDLDEFVEMLKTGDAQKYGRQMDLLDFLSTNA
jgi:excisionase family DNA binding protein